jgi:hypothetical protein
MDTPNKDEKNMCDGCQRGFPITGEVGYKRYKNGFHYDGRKILGYCTKDRYVQEKKESIKLYAGKWHFNSCLFPEEDAAVCNCPAKLNKKGYPIFSPSQPKEEDWREELMFGIMEDYIMTAELGHLAKDPKKHKEELRSHYKKLESFIESRIAEAELTAEQYTYSEDEVILQENKAYKAGYSAAIAEIEEKVKEKKGEFMMKANGADNKNYVVYISEVNGMDIILSLLSAMKK